MDKKWWNLFFRAARLSMRAEVRKMEGNHLAAAQLRQKAMRVRVRLVEHEAHYWERQRQRLAQ